MVKDAKIFVDFFLGCLGERGGAVFAACNKLGRHAN